MGAKEDVFRLEGCVSKARDGAEWVCMTRSKTSDVEECTVLGQAVGGAGTGLGHGVDLW